MSATGGGALVSHVVAYVAGVRDGMALRDTESRPAGLSHAQSQSYALGLEEGARRRLSGSGDIFLGDSDAWR